MCILKEIRFSVRNVCNPISLAWPSVEFKWVLYADMIDYQ